jgi:carboxypeptidase T
VHPLLRVGRSSIARGLAVAALVVALAASFAAGTTLLGPSSPRVAIRVAGADAAACARVEAIAVDVWSGERGPGLPLDAVVRASDLDELAASGVAWTVLVADVDAAARAEGERLSRPAPASGDWFAEYRGYDEIATHLGELADGAPGRASLHDLGTSLDGRTLWALRVGGAHEDDAPMLVNGALHAREWISAMATTCVADRLVRDYDDDPAIQELVDTTEVWIVPVVNPDGYRHSWEKDRYWRKNRRGGYGVDVNRNFSVAWGGDGSSGVKRSEIYRGEEPFSENESAALRALALREGIQLHLDFHSYGQMILYPWAYTDQPTADEARFAALGDRIAGAMYAAHGTRYRLMRGIELYASAGTLSDWMYGEAGAVSFTIELRPRGGSGFVLPPAEIRPTCDEALAAVLALRAPL